MYYLLLKTKQKIKYITDYPEVNSSFVSEFKYKASKNFEVSKFLFTRIDSVFPLMKPSLQRKYIYDVMNIIFI